MDNGSRITQTVTEQWRVDKSSVNSDEEISLKIAKFVAPEERFDVGKDSFACPVNKISENDKVEPCQICKDKFQPFYDNIPLDWGHLFHYRCLSSYIQSSLQGSIKGPLCCPVESWNQRISNL